MNAGDAEVRGTTIEAIQQAVADMFGLPAEQLRQKSPRGVATGSFVRKFRGQTELVLDGFR